MNLQGKFGMLEMEDAAKEIIKITAGDLTKPFSADMISARVGIIELAHHGWLTKDNCIYNGQFKVHEDFIKRINL